MKISVWCIGKTDEKYLKDGMAIYLKRLKHYARVEWIEYKDVKPGSTPEETTHREADMILTQLKSDDFLILMDERGHSYTSVEFSAFIEKLQLQAVKHVIFLIGGAYGHHAQIRARANHAISLSMMTFSHQMVRLFLTEQLYRAFTILRNEKYHNE
ncbi:MAG: 23S rRNA (pseudouridine(1915)-N(3))-methyltransferase RlmH [Saprospiraceae bacterium]|nr:MAG: 50S rRNA methyltransferase [Bacteroidetes bacterium OLB9]MCO6463862.1 23S rRNA (pseudouridine(1915)-N(3))-methyltransferase RlmH [Saprospiraceae bacterium]MCZ2339909.1 23S rRNA (pseudouridine(1915)-N(3))-methyltransferase RlmH [Chitinophagales bacterium]